MRTIAAVLLRWVVGNVAILLPLWLAVFGSLPSYVTISISSDKPIVMSIGNMDIPFGGGNGSVDFYLLPEVNPVAGEYKVSQNIEGVDVQSVNVRLWYCLKIQSTTVEKTESGFRIVRWSPSLMLNSYGLLFLFMEISLLCGAFAFVRRRETERLTVMLAKSMALAGLLVLLFAVSLPVQSFLANRSAFEFSTSVLILSVVKVAVFGFVLLSLLILAIRRIWGPFSLVALLACILYVYLETGILARDYPSLDGSLFFYLNTKRGILDFCVFLAVVGGVSLFWRRVYRGLYFWTAGAGLMILASLFDVRVQTAPNESSRIPGSYLPREEIAAQVAFSTNKNVIVFILDSVSCEHAASAFNRHPELARDFAGFTFYTNNVGMYPFTNLGIAGMFTGERIAHPDLAAEYAASIFTTNSVVSGYVADGDAVYFCPGSFHEGYANEDLKKSAAGDAAQNAFGCRIADQQRWNLRDVVTFRVLPFALKSWFMGQLCMGWGVWRNPWTELAVYESLKHGKVGTGGRKSFHVYHTEGAHAPFLCDEQGYPYSSLRSDYEAEDDKTISALRSLGGMLRWLDDHDIENASTIVVCADHGGLFAKRQPLPRMTVAGKPFPFLMVKPFGCKDEFSLSAIPTSHAGIMHVLQDERSRNLTEQEIESRLTSSARVYSQVENGQITEWHFDAGNGVTVKDIAVRDFEIRDCVQIGKLYDLTREKSPVRLKGGDINWDNAPCFGAKKNEVCFSCRVSDENARYDVLLIVLSEAKKGSATLRVRSGEADSSYHVQHGGLAQIEISGVSAGRGGLINISLLPDGDDVKFVIKNVRVTCR